MLVPVVRRPSVASRSSRSQLAFLDELVEALFDRCPRAVERRRGHVDELHFKSCLREDLRDAVAHGARADHSYPFDVEHATSPRCRLSG